MRVAAQSNRSDQQILRKSSFPWFARTLRTPIGGGKAEASACCDAWPSLLWRRLRSPEEKWLLLARGSGKEASHLACPDRPRQQELRTEFEAAGQGRIRHCEGMLSARQTRLRSWPGWVIVTVVTCTKHEELSKSYTRLAPREGLTRIRRARFFRLQMERYSASRRCAIGGVERSNPVSRRHAESNPPGGGCCLRNSMNSRCVAASIAIGRESGAPTRLSRQFPLPRQVLPCDRSVRRPLGLST